MSANATGTPTTTFSIPKFNTASDAPNGKGVNEMMDALDALIGNPAVVVTRPASIAANEVPVWNGSTFVRSSSVRINNGGQQLPIVTTSTLAGGPPGSPNDGDIWIATAVDANGTRWSFQFNAGSASASKWEFIGGPPLAINVDTAQATASGSFVDLTTVGPSYTTVRAGDYHIAIGAECLNNTVGGSTAMAAMVAGGEQWRITTIEPGGTGNATRRAERSLPVTGIGAAAVIKMQYAVSAGSGTFGKRDLRIIPIRIA